MAQNPTIVPLDADQIIQRCYDGANDALRMEIGGNTEISISLDPTDDAVTVFSANINSSGTITSTSSTNTQVIAAASCKGMTRFQLYATATTITAGTVTVRLDFNPLASGGVFFQSADTLSLNASAAGTIVASSIFNQLASQVQVTITANGLTSGETATIYLVGSN